MFKEDYLKRNLMHCNHMLVTPTFNQQKILPCDLYTTQRVQC